MYREFDTCHRHLSDRYILTVLISKGSLFETVSASGLWSKFKIRSINIQCLKMILLFLLSNKSRSALNAMLDSSLFAVVPRLLTQFRNFNIFCAHLTVTIISSPFFSISFGHRQLHPSSPIKITVSPEITLQRSWKMTLTWAMRTTYHLDSSRM